MTRTATIISAYRMLAHLPLRVTKGSTVTVGVAILVLVAGGYTIQAVESSPGVPDKIEATHTWSPGALGSSASRLIFVSDRSGNYHIYEKVLGSSYVTALTAGSYNDMNPQISPDQTRLVFYSDRAGSNQIYLINLQYPAITTQLTHDTNGVNDYDPVFMPDGQHIVYKKSDTGGNYGNIWEMNVDGTDQHDLTPMLTARGIEGWKPTPVSNSEVVFTERARPKDSHSDNLYILNIPSDMMHPLTDNSLSNWYPDFNSQTRKLIYITKKTEKGNDVLAVRGLSGGTVRVLVGMPGDNDDPSWSRDGEYIVFINGEAGSYDVYAASGNDGDVQLLDRSPSGSSDLSPLFVQ